MYKRILIPLDGSSLAEQALPYALTFAKKGYSELVLIQVHEPILSGRAAAMMAERKIRLEAELYLNQIARRIQANNIQVKSTIVVGAAPGEILRFAEKQQINLIAMSKRGQSGVTRWLIGGVAERVLRRARMPVLIVPAVDEQALKLHGAVYRRILVPLDGSPLAEGALSHGIALAGCFQAELVLVYVGRSSPDVENGAAEVQRNLQGSVNADYLTDLVQGAENKGIRTRAVRLTGRPEREIVRYSESNQVDLIVMSTHGMANKPSLLLGSVAGRVTRGANIPLLLIRGPKNSKGMD